MTYNFDSLCPNLAKLDSYIQNIIQNPTPSFKVVKKIDKKITRK